MFLISLQYESFSLLATLVVLAMAFSVHRFGVDTSNIGWICLIHLAMGIMVNTPKADIIFYLKAYSAVFKKPYLIISYLVLKAEVQVYSTINLN